MSVRFFTSDDLILIVDDEYHKVSIASKDIIKNKKKKLVKGEGYTIGEYVYVYRGKKKKSNKLLPGIYLDDDNKRIIIEPTESQRKKYHIDNIIELDTEAIFRQVENGVGDPLDVDYIESININGEKFTPTIKEDDDFLKVAVKKIILDKDIDLKPYRNLFPGPYSINNMKSSLIRSTKMTVTNFKTWCETMGVEWELTIRDNGTDKVNPLPEEFTLYSKDF